MCDPVERVPVCSPLQPLAVRERSLRAPAQHKAEHITNSHIIKHNTQAQMGLNLQEIMGAKWVFTLLDYNADGECTNTQCHTTHTCTRVTQRAQFV